MGTRGRTSHRVPLNYDGEYPLPIIDIHKVMATQPPNRTKPRVMFSFSAVRHRVLWAGALAIAVVRLHGATIEELAQTAATGSADAQLAVALAYDEGTGVPRDAAQALVWYRRAADQGSGLAELQLGYWAEVGNGAPIDLAAARAHYERALNHGAPAAGLRLGLLHLEGWGGPRDRAGAIRLIQAAAEAGDRPAEQILSGMYFAGWGVPHDLSFAAVWQQRAIESDETPNGNTETPIERIHRRDHDSALALNWYQLSAEDDYRIGLIASVVALVQPSADSSEVALGRQWLENAAAQNDPQAQWLLASLYVLQPQLEHQTDLRFQARGLFENARAAGSYEAAQILEGERPGHPLAAAITERMDEPIARATLPDPPGPDSGDVMPKVYRMIHPLYPWAMRRANQEDKVMVDFVIDPTGRVQRAYALKPNRPEFAQWAVLAVNQWRFVPGIRRGHPVNVHMQVPVIFTLNETIPSLVIPDPR